MMHNDWKLINIDFLTDRFITESMLIQSTTS